MSGTTLRFGSLVAAVLGTATYAFASLYTALPAHAAVVGPTYARCEEAYRHALPAPDADLDRYAAGLDRARQDLIRCVAPVERPTAAWVLVGLAVLLAVAVVLHLATPGWIRRRGRLVEITADGFPRLHAELVRLTAVAGLGRPPTFLLDPTAGSPGGLAFGRAGRYAVRINAGLVPLSVTDPGTFRAVVLHELAHLRNRDVDLAYAVVALWRAFVVVALVPMVVLLLHPTLLSDPGRAPWHGPGYLPGLVHLGGRAALFVAVAYLARNAVLRARETHADARAAEFGAGVDLRAAVARTATPTAARGRLRRLGVHPTVAARLAAIDDPVRRHRPGVGELFVAGLTTVIAFSGLTRVVGLVVTHDGWAAPRAAAWIVAPVVTGILGAVAWRARLGAGAPADRTRVVVVAALAFALGWLVGDLVTLNTPLWDVWDLLDGGATVGRAGWGVFGGPWSGGELAGGTVTSGYGIGSGLLAAAVLAGGLVAQAGVSAAGARTWSARGATGRWSWALGAAVTALPFAVWLGIWHPVHGVPYLVGHLYRLDAADVARAGVDIWIGPGFALLTLSYPPLEIFRGQLLAAPVVALAWLYPLAAGLWRRPVAGEPGLREGVRTALRVALVGAAVFALAVLATRAALRLAAPERVAAATFNGYFYYLQIAAVAVVQAVVGGVLAARGRPLGLVLGQFAAALVALLGTVAVLAGQTLGGCVPAFRLHAAGCHLPDDLPWALTLLRTLAVKGALAALLAGTAVVVVRAALRRLPARLAVDRPAARWAWSAALLVLLLGTGGLVLRGAYDGGGATAIAATPSPSPVNPAPPSPSSPAAARPAGRPLTRAEVTAAAGAAGRGLPAGWKRKAPSSPSKGRFDPPACRPLATAAHLTPLARARRATAERSFTNGGRVASSTLSVDVVSYASVVPESVLMEAERNRAACARFRYTGDDGFRLDYRVHAADPPRLGDQAWRVEYDLATVGGVRLRARQAVVVVRVDHTLVTVSLLAIEEPLDDGLLRDALARTVAALPG
ncbi:M48 family metalloprotease [Micromonospora auratinigra]|uniref:M48 family metalloprotease n=1 Tax=Micromonospora auratinigra TaxID=261654 RepID=UPI0012FD0745|nr:M48 family metalloprotease [Micromonospora auratinigra]